MENEKKDAQVDVFVRMNTDYAKKQGYNTVRKRIGNKIVEGIIIKDSKEFEEKYTRLNEAEARAELRSKRCLKPDGKGGYIRCPGSNSCSKCEVKDKFTFSTNLPLSLDELSTSESNDGSAFEVSDKSVNVEADALALIMFDELMIFLSHHKDARYKEIFRLLYDGFKVADIAKEFRMPWSTANDLVFNVRKVVKDFLKLDE